MRSLLLAVALLASVPAVTSAAEPRQAGPSLRAEAPTCRTGATPDERYAVFTGSMPARPQGDRMAMRFDLQIRKQGERSFTSVRAPSFGRWERSQPGRRGFIYSKRIDGLTAPAAYRAVVRFRWYAADGTVVMTQRRTTPSCTQPDPRPNLRLLAVRTAPGTLAGTVTYLLTVVNSGRGPAGAFEVEAGPDDDGQAGTITVGGMAAREARVIEVSGRPCAVGGRVRVRLDARAAVAESDERDNDVRRDCPAAG